jgi:hypothetical protein
MMRDWELSPRYISIIREERKDVEQMLKYLSTKIIKTEFLEGKIYLEPQKSNMYYGLYNTSTPTITHG